MLKTRVIPVLLLKDRGFVKTVKFKKPTYLGDPKNIVRLFNDKEVDELVILDITASVEGRKPDFDYLSELTVECFMPVCYGGGIDDPADVKRLFSMGIEKVSVNSYAFENPLFIRELSEYYGSQSIVVSMDVKKNFMGKYRCYGRSGRKSTDPVEFAVNMQEYGAGEILLNSVDRDGTMSGYDIELLKQVASAVDIPVIACGGAGKPEDFREAVLEGGADAAAAGSLFVFQGVHRAVLISYPGYKELEKLLKQ
ncbi:MAG: imidazole glycerol phosphate synthase subunit HisF [bacterium]|nr:imidazole glycerol phosphate synthase subunit HisF [bacterium]